MASRVLIVAFIATFLLIASIADASRDLDASAISGRNLQGVKPTGPQPGKPVIDGDSTYVVAVQGIPVDVANAKPRPMPQAAKFSGPSDDVDTTPLIPSVGMPGNRGRSDSDAALTINDDVNGTITSAASSTYSSPYPFTTQGAYSSTSSSPTNLYPWRASGKLFFVIAGATYQCSASLIAPGLVVTAAHCVCDFGKSTFFSGWKFYPAYHDGQTAAGVYSVRTATVPSTYFRGTDVCSQYGVVCENDLAILVLYPVNGVHAGATNGYYGYASNYGFVSGFASGGSAGQITQLGYPSAFSSGNRMIRTDAVAVAKNGYQFNIGSAQTGGSSGGPWVVNFGASVSATVSLGNSAAPNNVVAVTSYGVEGQQFQGASRFGTNTAYPTTSNIQSLVTSICNGLSTTDKCPTCGNRVAGC